MVDVRVDALGSKGKRTSKTHTHIHTNTHTHTHIRAAPLGRVIVSFTVEFPV